MSRIKLEEITALGDFIRTSFLRDQQQIIQRYPKLDSHFLKDFTDKLTEVKNLESGIVLTQAQKTASASLYAEAEALDDELSFVGDYMKEIGLDKTIFFALRKDLNRSNIEGAVLKIEALKQYLSDNQDDLVSEGMPADFAATLQAHKVSLAAKNEQQNSMLNSRKALTSANKAKYDQLYGQITKISNAGKKVFNGTITKDEYNISSNISRMRASRRMEATAKA